MRKLALTTTLAALLLLPASASATVGRTTDRDVTGLPIVQRYLAADAAYWHASPQRVAHENHCRNYTIEVGETREETRAESPEPGCWQRIGQGVWEEIEEGNLRLGCMVSEHEYGHSVGHPDEETDPTNIMFVEGPPLGAVPGCMSFPVHGQFPRPRDHLTSRSVLVMPNQSVSFRLGMIPAKASVATTIRVDGHAVFGASCGPLCELAGTEDVTVRAIAHSSRAPLVVHIANESPRAQRVAVQLVWAHD